MNGNGFLLVFTSLFLAELGDKTQLAVIGFATQKSPLLVFLASSFALVFATLLAVLFGSLLLKLIPLKVIHFLSASLLLLAGLFILVQAIRG